MESITTATTQESTKGPDKDRCEVGQCELYQKWQDHLWGHGENSPQQIRDMSENVVGECMDVNGCFFENTVEIQEVQDA